jgi:hypothetical protein
MRQIAQWNNEDELYNIQPSVSIEPNDEIIIVQRYNSDIPGACYAYQIGEWIDNNLGGQTISQKIKQNYGIDVELRRIDVDVKCVGSWDSDVEMTVRYKVVSIGVSTYQRYGTRAMGIVATAIILTICLSVIMGFTILVLREGKAFLKEAEAPIKWALLLGAGAIFIGALVIAIPRLKSKKEKEEE